MKRFLQGLGVGILATTLILTVSYYTVGNKKMSNKEIISEAKKLGMIQPTEQPLFSDGNKDKAGNQQGEEQQPSEVQTQIEGQQEGTEQQQPENNAGNQDEQPSEEENPEGQPKQGDDAVPSPEENEEVQNNIGENTGDEGVVQLVINEGDEAITVAQKLKRLGIVSDAGDFDRYLQNNSQSRSIQIGTFDLKSGMSYEEVAAIISGR